MADSAEFVLKLKDLFSKPANNAARASGNFSRAQMKSNRAMGKGAAPANKMAGAVKGLAAAYAALKVSQAAAAAGMAIFERSIKTNRLEAAFEALEHGGGKKRFEEISNLAMQMGLDIDATAKSYSMFMKMQFKPAAAKNLLKLGADMKALGSTAAETEQLFVAIGQIKAAGTLKGQEVMQLTNAGISKELLYKNIAKLRGKGETIAEMLKLQEAGGISAEMFMAAFEPTVNEKLKQSKAGESAKKFAETTIGGAVDVAKSRGQLMWIELNRGAEGGLAAGMTGAMKAFDKFAQSDNGQKTLKMIQELFVGIGDTMATVMPLVVELGGALIGGLMEGFNAFGEAMGFSVAEGGDWADLFRSMIPAITTAGKAMGFVAGIFVNGIKVIGLALTGVALGISGLIELGEMAFNWGKSIIDGLIKGIADGVYKLKETVRDVANAVKNGIKGALGIKSPSRVMMEYGKHTSDGFAIGMEKNMPDVTPDIGGTRTVATAASKMSAGMSGGSISVGNVTIQVEGSADPEQTAQATLRAFDRNLGAVLSRYAGEAGAPA